jgi:hypothetical protein
MVTRALSQHSENQIPFAKTNIANAMSDLFWAEATKLLALHDFKTLKPGVDGVIDQAMEWYFKVGVATNESVIKQAANDERFALRA